MLVTTLRCSHNLKGNLPNEGVVCKQASSHASYEIGSAAFRHHQKTVWWRAMMLEREQGLHPCTGFQLMTGPPAHSPSAQLSQASWPLLPLTSRCISFPSLSFLSFPFFSFLFISSHLISSHLISSHFISHLTVWGVEPIVTDQTSWLESISVSVLLLSVVSE